MKGEEEGDVILMFKYKFPLRALHLKMFGIRYRTGLSGHAAYKA